MGIRNAVVEGYQSWPRGQKPSLVVVLGNGPSYNPNFDVRFGRKTQFFGGQEVTVQQRSWQFLNAGNVQAPQDVFRQTQAKVFGEYQAFTQPMPLSPRVTTDYFQGNADIFHSQDNYGWPPPPVPEYWSPSMPGTAPVLNSFPPYNPAPDVFMLRDQDKTFDTYQEQWGPLKPLGAIGYTYTVYLDPTVFRRQDKTFKDYDSYWQISMRASAVVRDAFLVYNPATDVTRFKPQAKTFDEYQTMWGRAPITINAVTFFPPPYNPAIDVTAKPRASQFMVPYDDSQWNTGQKPAYNIVLNVTPAPPPTGVVIGLQPFGGRVIFNPKYAGSDEIVPFDYMSKLNDGESILSAAIAISVYSGVDPSVNLQVNGGIVINGSIVNQKVQGGIVGVVYEIKCTAVTNLGQTLILVGYLNVEPELT